MWILGFGGLGITLGLAMFGKRVIMTIGSESTGKMTSSRGFCVEWVAAVTVLIASLREIAIPVSLIHCQIGGVVGAGVVTFLDQMKMKKRQNDRRGGRMKMRSKQNDRRSQMKLSRKQNDKRGQIKMSRKSKRQKRSDEDE